MPSSKDTSLPTKDHEQQRSFKGVWIPTQIYLAEGLSWTEKLLFIEIDSLSNNGRGCFASNKYLGQFLGVGEQAISNGISKLKSLGLVKQTAFDGRVRNLKTDYKKIYSLPIKKIIGSNIGSILVEGSKEPNGQPEGCAKRKSKFIERWNSYPQVPKHPNPDTKVYQQAKRFFSQLMRGKFHENKGFDKEWFAKHKIPIEWLHKRWSAKDIICGLEDLSLLFMEGYWPPDKKKLPRSLHSLLYNPRTNTSLFFMTIVKPPTLLSRSDSHPEITNLILSTCKEEIVTKEMIRFAESLFKFNRDKIPDSRLARYSFPKTNPQELVSVYISWLKEQDWLKTISSNLFDTEGKVFSQFIDYIQTEYAIELINL